MVDIFLVAGFWSACQMEPFLLKKISSLVRNLLYLYFQTKRTSFANLKILASDIAWVIAHFLLKGGSPFILTRFI